MEANKSGKNKGPLFDSHLFFLIFYKYPRLGHGLFKHLIGELLQDEIGYGITGFVGYEFFDFVVDFGVGVLQVCEVFFL